MSGASLWAIVPVKPFHLAKTRLAPLLAPRERAGLARVMLEDVLAAVAASGGVLNGAIVATADADAAGIARRFGVDVLVESAPGGVNAAVTAVRQCLGGTIGQGMIVIPSDLPQLSRDAVERAGALLAAPRSVALARAGDGGTNLLGCTPACLILPRFGPGSFDAHRHAAKAAGVTPGILEHAGLENDLDRPDDLARFLSTGTPTRTHVYLTGLVDCYLDLTTGRFPVAARKSRSARPQSWTDS
jgi:2-phospho-L-lactate/phosphoenolpyruvate guanylyltransferase